MTPKFIFCLSQSFLIVFLIVSISYAQETLSKEEQVEKYYNQAFDYYNAGEYEKAIEYYTKVIELDSSYVNAYLFRSSIYGQQENYEKAIKDLSSVNELVPEFASAYGKRGWYLLLLDKHKEAFKYCKIACDLDTSSMAWTINLGHAYLLLGEQDSAKIYYEKSLPLIKTIEEYEDGPLADFEIFIEKGYKSESFKEIKEWYTSEFTEKYSNSLQVDEFAQTWKELIEKATQYNSEGNYITAISFAEKALEQCKIEYGMASPPYGISLSLLAVLYETMGCYEEALPLYLEALENTEKSLGRDHPDYGISLNNLALLYKRMGRYEEALPLYLEALENIEKTLGKKHPDYGKYLNNLANLYNAMGRYEEALPLYLEALENTENSLGKDHSSYGTRLNNLAVLYTTMDKYEEALPLYLEALKNTEKTLTKNHSRYGKYLNNFANLYNAMGKYEEALPLYLEALKNTENTLTKQHPDYGTYLNNLALLYGEMGRYDETLPLYLEALENTEKTLGKKHSRYGKFLNNFANLYNAMGKYEEALSLYLEALKNTWKTLGKKHPDYGKYLNNLAVLYKIMGKYEDALPLYLEALKNTEKTLGKNHSEYGSRLNNFALLYETMGRYEEALPLYLEALENTKSSLGTDHSDYGIRLNNLAALYQTMGRYEEALPLYLEALENVEKTLDKKHPNYGKYLNNLAVLYKIMGKYEEALPLYLEALENTKSSLGTDHSDYGIRLNNLAALYQTMGRYEEALPLYLEALENKEKTLGKDHSDYGTLLNNFALLYETMGRYDEALPLYLEANRNLHNQIKSIFSFSSENEKKVFFKTLSKYYKLYQSFHFTTSGVYSEMAELMYNNQLILKGLILAGSKNMLEAIRVSGGEQANELYNNWQGLKRRLEKEYRKPISKQVSYLDSLETEANKIEGKLVSLSQDFMTEKQKQEITWKDVQNKLDKGDIAIEFASFHYFNKKWTDSTLYVAYVVTAESEFPEMVYLFEENELNKLLKQSSPNKLYALRGIDLLSPQIEQYGEDLYNLIIKPLDKHLEGKERIYFSTDGKLHQFAFAAFPSEEGDLLCNKYELVQLNSTGQLALDNKIPGKEPVILVGGIEFEYSINQTASKDSSTRFAYNYLEDESSKLSESNHNRGEDWPYLPGTKAEVEKLIKLFEADGLSANILTGSYATEESIKKLDGNSPKVLHLATHGFFFENPKNKHKEQNPASFDEKQSYSVSEDPLMRSGLILAGGNYAWENGSNPYEREDGILTAYEISNLNLLQTDLVVLSACETGLGDIEGSEGVYGLQRAFRMAGVEYIIMSLWSVPDDETVEFMETFYTNWLGGLPIREAFNTTQKLMSKKYLEEPEKWAAFVLLE